MLTTCNCLCCQRNRAEHGFYYSTSDNSIPCETYFNQELGIGCKKDLQIKDLEQKLAKQSELLAKAVEGLKFYGDTAKWQSKNSLIQQSLFYDGIDSEIIFKQGVYYGGKLAREILKELGGIEL